VKYGVSQESVTVFPRKPWILAQFRLLPRVSLFSDEPYLAWLSTGPILDQRLIDDQHRVTTF